MRWDALILYAEDDLVEIDNNPIEREIRPIALGRKNDLFASTDPGNLLYYLVLDADYLMTELIQ